MPAGRVGVGGGVATRLTIRRCFAVDARVSAARDATLGVHGVGAGKRGHLLPDAFETVEVDDWAADHPLGPITRASVTPWLPNGSTA